MNNFKTLEEVNSKLLEYAKNIFGIDYVKSAYILPFDIEHMDNDSLKREFNRFNIKPNSIVFNISGCYSTSFVIEFNNGNSIVLDNVKKYIQSEY